MQMNNNLIEQFIEEHSETVKKFDSSKIDKAVKIMIDALNNNSKSFFGVVMEGVLLKRIIYLLN